MPNREPRKKKVAAPRLVPFSWWSLDIAEDLGIVETLMKPGGIGREQRDAFALLIWAHLADNDPAWIEAEIEAGRAVDHARTFRRDPASLLSIPDLPRLLGEFEALLNDERLADVIALGAETEAAIGPEDYETEAVIEPDFEGLAASFHDNTATIEGLRELLEMGKSFDAEFVRLNRHLIAGGTRALERAELRRVIERAVGIWNEPEVRTMHDQAAPASSSSSVPEAGQVDVSPAHHGEADGFQNSSSGS